MRSSFTFGFGILALAISASALARPDLNSFVNRKVDNTQALVSQVKADPVVADRYERHFAMNRQELVSYLSTLHRGSLPSEGNYTIYSVPTDGHVKMHLGHLKRGEPMFLDASGKPTLIVKCGNPVVLGPARARKANLLTVVPTDNETTRQLSMLTPRDAEVEMPTDLLAMLPPVPTEATPVPPPADVVTEEAPITSVPATATGGAPFPWIAGLPLLIPIFGGLHHGGGGGGTAPVPEPATIMALSIGIVGIARRRKS